MKICRRCRIEKPLTEFYISNKEGDGHQYYCKPCSRMSAAEWMEANHEQKKDNYKAWYEKNKEHRSRYYYEKRYGMSKATVKNGIRIKGGVQYGDYNGVRGFYPIMHIWDNADCLGEAEEWTFPKSFDTEDEAMKFYVKNVQPLVNDMINFNIDEANIKIDKLIESL